MDKTALLVVLGLQTLLLVSAFTSADAAALTTDDQQRGETLQLSKIGDRRVKDILWIRSGCYRRPGACSSLKYDPPTDLNILLSPQKKERTKPGLKKTSAPMLRDGN